MGHVICDPYFRQLGPSQTTDQLRAIIVVFYYVCQFSYRLCAQCPNAINRNIHVYTHGSGKGLGANLLTQFGLQLRPLCNTGGWCQSFW